MRDRAHERRQRLTGVALMCGAVACFAGLDASAKYLNAHMDTLQVVWARYTSAFLLTLILSNPFSRPGLIKLRPARIADFPRRLVARLDAAQFPCLPLPAARRSLGHHVLDAVHGRGAVGAAARRMGRLAPLGGDRRRLSRRAGGDAADQRRHSSGGAVLRWPAPPAWRSTPSRPACSRAATPPRPRCSIPIVVGALVMLPVLPFVWTTPKTFAEIGLMIASWAPSPHSAITC